MKKYLFVVTLCLSLSVFGQNFKFGKVSDKEVAEKQHPTDPEANAAVLYREYNTKFDYTQEKGFYLITEVYERIKIYNANGFDWGTVEIDLYEENNRYREELSNLKGRTYFLDASGKVEEEKLRNDGIFEEKMNKYYVRTKFTMPALKDGCVIEYTYTIRSPFIGNIDTYAFQEEIPVNKVYLRFAAPEYFNFKMHRKGWLMIDIKEENRSRTMDYRYTRSSLTTGSAIGNTVNRSVEFTENIYEVDMEDVPSLKVEEFAGNLNNYTTALDFELSYVRFPDAPVEMYATTWEAVSEKIYKSDSFGGQLDQTRYFESDLDAILAKTSTPIEKMVAIFEFVKQKMKWNEIGGYYTDEGVKAAYKEGAGNVADINLMLTAMFRYAGLNANPVLISTKAHGISLFPTRNGFNYVVASVIHNGGIILFDATARNAGPGDLDENLFNWQGRLVRADGTSDWVPLTPGKPSQAMFIVNAALQPDGTLTGETKGRLTGNRAFGTRNEYNGEVSAVITKDMQPDTGEINDLSFENMDNPYEPLTMEYTFDATELVEEIDGSFYVSPMFFYALNENPFKLEERQYPIDYEYKKQDRYIINLQAPDGYQFESYPESINLIVGENKLSFKFITTPRVNTLQLMVDFGINVPMLDPSLYADTKAFYQALVEKEKEKVVISKV